MYTVTLTEVEVKLSGWLDRKRAENNKKRGVKDNYKHVYGWIPVDEFGTYGEFAVARYYNVYPNLWVEWRPDSYDIMLCDRRIDVKTTDRINGRLFDGKREKQHCDAYILVIGHPPTFKLVGWCWFRELCNEVNWKLNPLRWAFEMRQHQLRHMSSLIESLTSRA